MEENVRNIDLPRVFRHFLEELRKITTKSVRINCLCVDINPESSRIRSTNSNISSFTVVM